MDSTRPSEAWGSARARLRLLENSAETMSSSWFLGNAAIIASVVLLLVTAGVLAGSAGRVLDRADKVDRDEQTVVETAALQASLDEASIAARAYALSRDPRLLAVRTQAKQAIRMHLDRLAGQPATAGLVQALDKPLRRRVSLFDRLIANHAAAAPAEEMERIHLARLTNAMITTARADAAAELDREQHHAATDIQLSMWAALFAAIVAPLCGLIGIHLLRRERDSRRSRELQLELMHVQRLAIMGETSAMLAHEINQPLTAATNYLSVMRRHLDTGATDKATGMAERIGQQIQRASTILKKLRRFIEKRETERSLEAPEVLVEDAITLLGTIDPNLALETCIDPGLPHVMVDRVQLQQVLVNLMRNAIEAMQSSPRCELRLSVRSLSHDAIEISLADSGPGLPAEVASKLFQPFVSTKKGGMGVGLSITRSIIEQHGGHIWSEPNPGGGTIFRFTLPAARERLSA